MSDSPRAGEVTSSAETDLSATLTLFGEVGIENLAGDSASSD